MYYHVSRLADALVKGQLVQVTDIEKRLGPLPDGTADFVSRFLPSGMSYHGAGYPGIHAPEASLVREFALELVRRDSFPERLSRFQCFFAWTSLDDCLTFVSEVVAAHLETGQSKKVEVWYIHSDSTPFIADMNFLNGGSTWIDVLARAEQYWQGERTPHPLLEALLPLPVKVISKVGRFVCEKSLNNGHERWGATFCQVDSQ